MFHKTYSFNQDIGSWDVRDPRRLESRGGASTIVARVPKCRAGPRVPPPSSHRGRRSLTRARGRHVRAMQVSRVTTMYQMFSDAYDFNQDLGWCLKGVYTYNMFYNTPCKPTKCGVTHGNCGGGGGCADDATW